MKFNKFNKEGLAKLEHFANICAINDIQIRQTSNSMRIYSTGRTQHGGEFDIEVRSGSVSYDTSMLAVLGHMIHDHEEKGKLKNV